MTLTVAASVTRDELGLGVLNINDHVNYILTPTILGGSVAWQRNQVSSPYMDGDITINRRRPNIIEPMEINVYGVNQVGLAWLTQALINAFSQNNYNLGITIDGHLRQYYCESADYSIEYNNAKMASHMCMVRFQVPRNPIPISGP